MSSEDEEFYQKFEGYKIPRKAFKPAAEPEGPFVGPPETNETKSKKLKYDTKEELKSPQRSPKKFTKRISGGNEVGSNKFDPLALDHVPTYGEARGRYLSHNRIIADFLSQFDGKLPDEIVSKCTECKCDVCNVEFVFSGKGKDSNCTLKMAQSHYQGKNHMKKVKQELHEWQIKDPVNNIIPNIKIKTSEEEKSSNYTEDQDQTFCHTCEIELTSKVHAHSHYTGKPHAKKVQKLMAEGTYFVKKESFPQHVRKREADGNLTPLVFPDYKKPKVEQAVPIFADAESRQGSGNRFYCLQCKLNFKSNGHFNEHLQSQSHKEKSSGQKSVWEPSDSMDFVTVPSTDSIDDMLSKLRNNPQSAFDCTLCQVQCSSQVILSAHLVGKQHKKKLELSQGSSQASGSNFRCNICNITTSDQNGLDMHFAGKKHQKKAANA